MKGWIHYHWTRGIYSEYVRHLQPRASSLYTQHSNTCDGCHTAIAALTNTEDVRNQRATPTLPDYHRYPITNLLDSATQYGKLHRDAKFIGFHQVISALP